MNNNEIKTYPTTLSRYDTDIESHKISNFRELADVNVVEDTCVEKTKLD